MKSYQLHKTLKVLKLQYSFAKHSDPAKADSLLVQLSLLSDKIISLIQEESIDKNDLDKF